MSHTVLLYGATGFSGRLIAAEGQRAGMASQDGAPEHRMVLGGRDGNSLEELADKHGMEYRTFSLDDRDDIKRGLRGVDVLINAAGPFAWTADRLVKGALDEGCHYVDINGEIDVYKKLDDFGRYAAQRKLAIVCSAGYTAAASDLLLDAALDHLHYGSDLDDGPELGAVRIAMSRVMNLSHGSAETLWRSLREQVTVVRTLEAKDKQGNVTRESTLWYEPVGKLERTFDFRDHGPRNKTVVADLRIASAANLVDTLTARLTVARRKFSVKRIESYVEAGTVARIGYQLGTLLAPVAAIPWVRFLAEQQIGLLPSGPTKPELRDEKQIVLLEIEDPLRTKIIDWRWETPNAYQFTAQVVVEIAKETTKGAAVGWLTPGAVLQPRKDQLTGGGGGALRDCRLDDRTVLASGTA
jgi:saccharopine dehydrogenase (NAD+, L-lysine-forming)